MCGMTMFVTDDLLDKDAYDVNGHHLGRITLTREAGGELFSFDILLDERAKREVDASGDFLTVDPEEVVATDFDVSLAEEGLFLAHPERAPPHQLPPGRL